MNILVVTNTTSPKEQSYVLCRELRKVLPQSYNMMQITLADVKTLLKKPDHNIDYIVNFSTRYDVDSWRAMYDFSFTHRVFNAPQYTINAIDKYYTYGLFHNRFKMIPTSLTPDFDYPCVLKTRRGSLGTGVFLVNNMKEEAKALGEIFTGMHFSPNGFTPAVHPIIYQPFIDTSFGKDLRVVCIGGKFVACELRENHNGDFKSNLAAGGTATEYKLTDEQIKLCEDIAQALQLDYVGLDMMFSGKKDQLIFNEANSCAMFAGISAATGINTAQEFAKYIYQEIEKDIKK